MLHVCSVSLSKLKSDGSMTQWQLFNEDIVFDVDVANGDIVFDVDVVNPFTPEGSPIGE